MSRQAPLPVQVFSGAQALSQVRPAWQALWQADPQADLFSGPAWFGWLLHHFGQGGAPAGLAWHTDRAFEAIPCGPWQATLLLVGVPGETPLALLPLVRAEGQFMGARRRLLSSPINFHAPRSGLPARQFDTAVAQALANAVHALPGWDVLLLDGLPAATGRANLLGQALTGKGLAAHRCGQWPSAHLSRQGSVQDYMAGPQQAHFRRSLVKSRNGLAKQGELTVRCLRGDQALGEGLALFFEVDAASWKARDGESVGRSDTLRAQYTALCHELARSHALEVWALWIGPRPAAVMICPFDGRHRYTLKSSFVEGVGGNRSPSMVLLHEIIQQSWDTSPGGFDFVGKVAFLDRWASEDRLMVCGSWWRSPLRLHAARWQQGLMRRLGALRTPQEA